MKVLFVTPPALRSHLYVQAPLAWALRNAGHQVRVAVQPDLVEAVPATGLTAVVVGEDMLERLGQIDQDEPPQSPRPLELGPPHQTDYAADDPFGELAYLTEKFLDPLCDQRIVADLVEYARAWRPDLVIWDQLCYAGMIAARASGAAHARLLFGTDALVQLRTNALRQRPDQDPMRTWLTKELDRIDESFAEDAVTGDWTIDTMPAWTWQPSGPHYLPMRNAAFNGPALLPDWLQEPPTRRRVCITMGLSHESSGVAHASTAELLEAVADLDVDVVAAISGSLDEVQVPPNVRAVNFVPLHALLPTCSVLIHQGGTGTFATAYEHGVPQLVVPSVYWSDRWFGPVAQARGVMDEGAGIYVADSNQLTASALRDALETVLRDPSFAANADRLRRRYLSVPGPNEVVPTLERLVAERRRR